MTRAGARTARRRLSAMSALRLTCLTLLAVLALAGCARTRPPGVLAPDPPEQVPIPDGAAAHAVHDYDLVPLARFKITARVLSTHRYRGGRESKLAPVDLALGWGRMSDSAVLSAFRISQSARAFHWSAAELPIPEDEILTSAANMHLIPADDAVRSRIEQVRAGDVVAFEGSLVEVFAREDDWSWCSSLSRHDTGNGACEVVYVESIEVR